MGAYAATCAYFIMISFVPFLMIFMALAGTFHSDVPAIMEGFLSIIPSGLKAYVGAVIEEVGSKSYVFVPLSVLVLLWSAAKLFHALTNGLNVISRVQETRGWFYLRLRSVMLVLVFFVFIWIALVMNMFGQNIEEWFHSTFPRIHDILRFLYSFRALFGYFGLILLFLFIYKFLPNCRYTFRSQFPGALIVSTVWMFFSYLMSLYYEHNRNFNDMYGSMTGMILAMIWLYFCAYFLLFGAELNRVLYEDPEDNVFINTLDVVKDASAKKKQQIAEELDEHSVWRPLADEEAELPVYQPKDIEIRWLDENEEKMKSAQVFLEALARNAKMPGAAADPIAAGIVHPLKDGMAEEEEAHLAAKKKEERRFEEGGWTCGVILNDQVVSGTSDKDPDEKVVNLAGGSNEWN